MKRIAYVVDGVRVFEGVELYVTQDGWVGILQADGRVDEAPRLLCTEI